MNIEIGDGFVFAIKQHIQGIRGKRLVGYGSAVVGRFTEHSITPRPGTTLMPLTLETFSVNRSVPAWIMLQSVIATTISRGEAQRLADELNQLMAEEAAAIAELPVLYEQRRQTVIAKYLGEEKKGHE